MSVIVYKCDTCKRELEIPENQIGLETVGRCVITNTCKGKLYPIDVKEAFISGKLPSDVEGLDNWVARKLLYNHNQNVNASSWKVVHNLGTNPAVQAYIVTVGPSGKDILSEVTPEDIITTSPNELVVKFSSPVKGIIQCISRSTALDSVAETVDPISNIVRQITADGSITIATPDVVVDPLSSTISGTLTLYSPTNTQVVDTIDLTFSPHSTLPQPRSPWRDSAKVLISGQLYSVWSTIIDFRSIPDGAPFVIGLTGIPSTNRSVVVLLSDLPHAIVDKNGAIYLDGGKISTIEQSVISTKFINGELFISESTINTVYPAIGDAG